MENVKTTYDTFKIDFEETLDEKQIVTQSNLDTSSKGGVRKISFETADVVITNSQVVNKQVKVQGQILIKVVYFDLENNIQSLDYISDFIENVTIHRIPVESELEPRAKVVDCVASISGEEIRVQTVVQLSIATIDSQDEKLLVDVENAIFQADLQRIQNFERFLNEEVYVSQEYQAGVPIDEILLFNINAIVENVTYHDYGMSVVGQCVANIMFKSKGEIVQKDVVMTFNKDIETTKKEPVSCPHVVVSNSNLTIKGSETNGLMLVDVNLVIKGAVFGIQEIQVITDLYSPSVGINFQDVYVPYYVKDGIFLTEEKTNGIGIVEDGGVKRIVSSNVIQNNIVNLLEVPGAIVNEGILVASVIYEKEDGTLDSIQIETPYTIRVDQSNLTSGCRLDASVLVIDIFSRVRRDNEIEIVASLISSICTCYRNVVTGIGDVLVGEPIPVETAGMTVYLPNKGETLWDVAKAVGMSKDEIKAQNPGLGDTMEGSERVVIYRELIV